MFDPVNRRYVAAGADRLANVLITLDEGGLPIGNPFPVAFARVNPGANTYALELGREIVGTLSVAGA